MKEPVDYTAEILPLLDSPSPRGASWPRFLDRLAGKFLVGDDCWEWTANKTQGGYGRMQINGRGLLAHRILYVIFVGEIPAGYELDHLCRNPSCVRPSHLEAVPHQVNILRSDAPPASFARRTHCVRGHELAGDNLVAVPRGSRKRRCKKCDAIRNAAYRQKKAAAALETP